MHNFTARIGCVILALGFADGLAGAWLYRYTPVPPSTLVFGTRVSSSYSYGFG
jgi:hypothetical protein